MNISNQARNRIISTLSIAEFEARKNAELFSTFSGDFSEAISNFLQDAELLREAIQAITLEN